MELGVSEGGKKKRDRSEGPNCAKRRKERSGRDRVPDSANRVKGQDRARVEGSCTLQRLQSFTEMHPHEEFIEEPLGRRDVSGIA